MFTEFNIIHVMVLIVGVLVMTAIIQDMQS